MFSLPLSTCVCVCVCVLHTQCTCLPVDLPACINLTCCLPALADRCVASTHPICSPPGFVCLPISQSYRPTPTHSLDPLSLYSSVRLSVCLSPPAVR
mmetsp:Transcript_11253/g.32656  ORF Transcript_11253/g.32656 Transcript_11253/m.32656 type:complete len:97 (-) Transcript_11253:541-831(-)